VILPTEEALLRRRRGYQRRGVVAGIAALTMVLSAFVPHVGVQAFDAYGRGLIGASRFFVAAQPDAEGFGAVSRGRLAFGLDITYLGLAAQQIGLLAGLGSFWSLAAATLGRWIRRLALLSGWLLALSAVLVVTGYNQLEAAGVPSRLGVAWVFTLVAGAVMVFGALEARKRLDSTWYWTKPDLNG
jgi:hypothetical protein